MTIHKSVLLKESIDSLNLKLGSIVVDATLGGGGHSLEILKRIIPEGKIIAFDRDGEAIERFKKRIASLKLKPREENIVVVKDNFLNIKGRLESLNIFHADAILADFGLSSDQLDDEQRGFSFKKDARLDMRMDQDQKLTAWEVVNRYEKGQLENLIRTLGDERYAKSIVREIEKERIIQKINSTLQLVEVIGRGVPGKYKRGKIHFATRTFQAIRMEVNQELESIEKFLRESIELLNTGGRLAVITFHSGEDRIAKNIFVENARGCICPKEFPVCRCDRKPNVKIITRKPVIPESEETQGNPRARSAKLRVIEKI